MQVHVDTDFGGDPDDACALAMLLGWPDVEILGITTNLDVDGERAGGVDHYLKLAGRGDVPVAAGAGASLTTGNAYRSTAGDARYWPSSVAARPGPMRAALDLLAANARRGATIVAIGASTNLAELELRRPGCLRGVPVVAMAGWTRPADPGMPEWGPEMDWNVQCDTRAAQIVAGAADLTLVTLPAAMHAHLRTRDLPRLRAAGAVGELLARQSETYALDTDKAALARAHPALPDDLVNFHWDPFTAAVAVGWRGVAVARAEIGMTVAAETLTFARDPNGRTTGVVERAAAADFSETFLACVESIP